MLTQPQANQIEAELHAEDERVGEWPPPQWWRDNAAAFNVTDPIDYMPTPDPPGTADLDEPLLRDNHGEPVDLGEPWGREGVAFGLCLLVIAVAVLLLVGAVL